MKPWMLAVMSGAPQLVTKTYTSSQTITIPLGVSQLEAVVGEGSDGAASGYAVDTITVANVARLSSQTSGATRTREYVFNLAASETDKFIGSGERTVSYTGWIHYVGQDNLVQTFSSTRSVRVRGNRRSSNFGGGSSASTITYADYQTYARVEIEVEQGPTNGSASTGFGKTFAGGAGGPAVPTTYNNVPVKGGDPYQLVIPVGGSITISYYL